MTLSEIKSTYLLICQLLENKQLKEALQKLQNFAAPLLIWEKTEDIHQLEANYRTMLNYSFEGIKDPEQDKLYNSLITKAYKIAEEIKEEFLVRNSNDFVFSQKRYLPYTYKNTSSDLINELESAPANINLSVLVEESLNSPGKRKEYAIHNETLSNQLFKTLWLKSNYSFEETNLIEKVVNSTVVSSNDKCLAISALTLSLMRFFNEKELLLLIEYCTHNDDSVAQRALVGLLPILAHYDKRLPHYPAIKNRLVMLFDNNTIKKHVKLILLQYARTNETEKISKKLKEEILPEMMKVAPKLKDKIDLDSLMKNDDPDEKNPEWQEILENSGIADKLKEFSDLQLEGSDVYMSTFAMLKNYPFFNEIYNWFKPFDATQSDIYELFEKENPSLLTAMLNNGYMCNSDRYSFCLSLMQMPIAQRETMSRAFKMEADQMKEIQQDDEILAKTKRTEIISNAYIQDLYRFYNLFPSKNDFEKPFQYSLQFHNCWFFTLIHFNNEEITQIAEYFFSKDFYGEALELFLAIEKQTEKTHDLYQKIGYCYQKTSDYKLALSNYLQAEIISPNQKWTIRKIAYVYKMLKDYKNALTYYLKAEEMQPDNQSIQTQIGNCYLNLLQYEEALAYYFKVEYASPENVKIWRAIAWTSFLSNKIEQAKKFLNKAIQSKEEWTDYLHLGHIAFIQKNKKEAISNYQKAFVLTENDLTTFIELFNQDYPYLIEKGIDAMDIAILMDYLRYSVE